MPSPARPSLPLASDDGHWLAAPSTLARFADVTAPAPRDRAFWSVAEALFATASGPPPPSRLAWLCDDVRDFHHHAGSRARFLFALALFFVTWIAPILHGRFPPFHRMSLEARVEVLERLEAGGIAQTGALLALKTIASMLYFEHPDAAREIGADGACRGEHR